MYIYCMVCYCVKAAPHVSVVVSLHTITLLMMNENAQWTVKLSLLHEVFPLHICKLLHTVCTYLYY